MRQKNETGGVLNSPDYGGPIGPGEEFEHDVLITGCTDLDAPDEPPEPDPPADVPETPDVPAASEETPA